jgi:hypothetical protein
VTEILVPEQTGYAPAILTLAECQKRRVKAVDFNAGLMCVLRPRAGRRSGSIPGSGRRFFSFPKHPEQIWGRRSLGTPSPGVKLTMSVAHRPSAFSDKVSTSSHTSIRCFICVSVCVCHFILRSTQIFKCSVLGLQTLNEAKKQSRTKQTLAEYRSWNSALS